MQLFMELIYKKKINYIIKIKHNVMFRNPDVPANKTLKDVFQEAGAVRYVLILNACE